jgi:hypothetical protein
VFLGGKELVVKLLLLWKQNAYIEYTAAAVSNVKIGFSEVSFYT